MPTSANKSTINSRKTATSEQFLLTIPRPIAEKLKLRKGQLVEWTILGKGRAEVRLE